MSFAYGQRHTIELEKAREYAPKIGAVKHQVVEIDLRQFGGSALTADLDVPKDQSSIDEIPITYVPARNTIFLSFALGWAEVLGASDIYVGVNALDYSGYPDCRPEFISAFENMANLATRAGVEGESYTIHSPLIQLSKAEIIRTGLDLGVDYGLTHSCYDPTPAGISCGHCDSCFLRLKGFREAGMADPIEYVTRGA
jgi:7-cyano-7-deazaguanine synthase